MAIEYKKTEGAKKPLPKQKRGRGRPSTGFDKKSWMREYMRKYRAEKGK